MSASVAPVQPTDRVSDVLARDEALVEVFVRHSPHFEKLRDGALRRVMARLVTVQQAAKLAAVPVGVLLNDLNDALRVQPDSTVGSCGDARAEDATAEPARVHPPARRIVELDVRDDLRHGREPFSRIMAATAALPRDEVLLLRAIFEPVPLFAVLARRGLVHEAIQHAPDDWSIWFWRTSDTVAIAELSPHSPVTVADGAEPVTVWLDVRGLQPPEPLMRTIAALETLPAGHSLVQVNERVPQLLFPMLAERGYACEVDESHAERVLVRIWRPGHA